jgi:hypothetical protein
MAQYSRRQLPLLKLAEEPEFKHQTSNHRDDRRYVKFQASISSVKFPGH